MSKIQEEKMKKEIIQKELTLETSRKLNPQEEETKKITDKPKSKPNKLFQKNVVNQNAFVMDETL